MSETDLTIEQAREFISNHDAYGAVRLYGVIADGEESEGQIVAIKSEYYLNKYVFSRIYTNNTTIKDMIRKL